MFCVNTNELLHLGWGAEDVEMLDERHRGDAIATLRREEVENALEPPELIFWRDLVVP